MFRKGFTDEVMFEIDFDKTLSKVVLGVGTISTAWDRFWSGPLYEGKAGY